jgi:hypothetical protein
MRILLAALTLLLAPPSFAEVLLSDAGWEISLRMRNQNPQYHRVDHWMFPPSPVPKRSRPRAFVTLKNPNGSDEHAVLLRYAFDARLRRVGTAADGVWTVPFITDEKRIPRVRAGEALNVPLPLNRVALGSYLKKMYNAGFWPDAFRVRVMVEPRRGESLTQRVSEATLPVSWRPGPRVEGLEEDGDE